MQERAGPGSGIFLDWAQTLHPTLIRRRNRYPGARFDSESYSYIFSFSQEVLDEWDWTEHFSPQPETLRYINFLTEKFDLRKDMQFGTRIESAHYQEPTNSWLLTDDAGTTYTCKYLITAMGILNEPTMPNINGVEDFQGESWHTARWPSESASLSGKRVGIIGTGATAIQTIQAIAGTVGSLKVFQRTPNWTAPLRNAKISKKEMQTIRQSYPDIFRKCMDSSACFVHGGDTTKLASLPMEERISQWEKLYELPGFAKVLSVSSDIFTDREANQLFSDFNAAKIRARVDDPIVAEKLIPKNHGFGTRRVPLENGYYEAFNQENVHLVDLLETPIDRVTSSGIKTSNRHHDLDIIIYATGFDAVTGSLLAVDFRGRNSASLKDVWNDGIRTYLGLTIKEFPNMFMIMGPHQVSTLIDRRLLE